MKTKKNIAVPAFFMVLLFFTSAFGQKRLEIGDSLPMIKLNNVYNYQDSVLHLNDFKGIPIIIDFWSTTCKSCLESFQKLDSLQKIFAGRVQFLLVNPQPFGPDSTDRLFKARSALFKPSIPFITQDTVLKKLLEPVGMPYMTWVGADGVIKYFSNNVTSNAIQQLIDDHSIGVNPYVRKRNYPTSIFREEIEPYVEYSSSITRFIVGTNPRNAIKNAVLSTYNSDITSLFKMAYNQGEGLFSNLGRIVLEVKDLEKFVLPEDHNLRERWYAENFYSYALALPAEKQHLKYQYMQEDLERFFNIEARVEKRDIMCYVLRSLSDAGQIATKGGPLISTSTAVYSNGNSDNVREAYVQQNLPYSRFVSDIKIFSEYRMKIPFVDLSKPLTTNIDVTYDGDLVVNPTFEKLQEFLLRHGYSISEEVVSLDVLVLRDSVN